MPSLAEFQRNFSIYVRNFLWLWTASALFILGSFISLGLLAGPLLLGLIALCDRLQLGEKGSFSFVLQYLPQCLPSLIPAVGVWLIILISMPIRHIPFLGLLWFLGVFPLVTLGFMLSVGFISQHDFSVKYALKRALTLIAMDPIKAWAHTAFDSIIAVSGLILARLLIDPTTGVFLGIIYLVVAVLPVPLGVLGLTRRYQVYLHQKPSLVVISKQNLRIFAVILALFVFVGLLFMRFEKPRTISRHFQRLPNKTSLRVPLNFFKTHRFTPRSTPKKLPRYKGELPEGFPLDIPIHPRIRDVRQMDYFCFSDGESLGVFPVDEDARKVFVYYQMILSAEGWSIRAYPQEPLPNIEFSKPGRLGILTVRRDQRASQVYIRLKS